MNPPSAHPLRGKLTPAAFLLLLTAEAVAAALFAFLIPADPKNALLLDRSLTRWVKIGGLLLGSLLLAGLGLRLRRSAGGQARLAGWLARAGLLPVGVNLLLFAVLLALDLSPASALRLAPLLGFTQLALLEYYWFFPPRQHAAAHAPHASRPLAVISALALLGAAALPGIASAPIDGLPWDSRLEFILVALILPAALLINWRVFARGGMPALALAALGAQMAGTLLLPEPGFGARIYTSPEKLETREWQRTYESTVWPWQSVVMTQSYEHMRQFPLEWIITDDYDFEQRWFALEVRGTVTLQPGERLIFQVAGEQEAGFTLTLPDGRVEQGLVLRPDDEIPAVDPSATYAPVTAAVEGRFVYASESDHALIPLIVRPDGSTISPFHSDQAWQSAPPEGSLVAGRALAWLADALLLLAATLGLAWALWSKYRAGRIAAIDLFLATWALGALWAAAYFTPAQVEGFILPAALALLAARFLAGFPDGLRLSRTLLAGVGLVLLALFLRLDLGDLRQIEMFPDGQDNFRYQVIARYIFTSGDPLQINRPPLIYKFLYPYITGGLHVLFGQSPAAQFYLNAWCALLTAVILSRILGQRGVSYRLRWGAVALWLALITGPSFFVFYFRFGLIEPLAVLLYSLAILLAVQHRRWVWLATGVTLTLLRLDYAVLLFSTLWLGMPVLEGGFRHGAAQMARDTLGRWRGLLAAGLVVSSLPVGLTLFFWLRRGVLITSASDTRHDSLGSIFEGWARIFTGGTPAEIAARFQQAPLDMLLFWAVIFGGLVFALLAWAQPKKGLDRRWLVLFVALLVTYIIVRPTGYSPRFSTPVVAMSILALVDGFYRFRRKSITNNANGDE